MRLRLPAVFLVYWWLASPGYSYRLLAFLPFPATSHHNAFAPLLHELAVRGHSVVYLTPVKPRLSHHRLEVRLIRPFAETFKKRIDLFGLGRAPKFLVPHLMGSTAESLAQEFYGDPAAQDIIHGTESFDAVLMESFFLQEPISTLAHKFACPAIELSSLGDSAWINELSGLPDNPAYQMDFKSSLSDRMTFAERLYNYYVGWSTVLGSYYYLWRMQAVADRYFNYSGWEARPPLRSLVSEKSLVLLNRDPLVASYPFPAAPHVKSVGGMNLLPPSPLPQEIQDFMDGAKHGVIYFSFGSNLKTSEISSGDIGRAFLPVLGKLRVKVLIKWELGNASLPDNMMSAEWLPQQDVLAHRHCKLFITHGGFLSLTESVYHGVPVLGVPFFGDQFKNMKQVEVAGYGLKLDLGNVSTESVAWAVGELLNKSSYREEAMRRSRMMRDRPLAGLAEAVYWVEQAVRYPGYLTPAAARLTFLQLHLIDIHLFLLGLAFLLYMAIRHALRTALKISRKRKEKYL